MCLYKFFINLLITLVLSVFSKSYANEYIPGTPSSSYKFNYNKNEKIESINQDVKQNINIPIQRQIVVQGNLAKQFPFVPFFHDRILLNSTL